jgi:hypothetical protein
MSEIHGTMSRSGRSRLRYRLAGMSVVTVILAALALSSTPSLSGRSLPTAQEVSRPKAAQITGLSNDFGQTPPTLSLKPASPIDPTAAVVDAFRSYSVVALGEGEHGNLQGHAFRLSLIRDPRFAAVANDIVVEFGNALYQDVIDSYINGGDVSYSSLRRVWENTTQPFTTFDSPVYKEFFEAVRSVNQTLPRGLRLRILLGDPPIDWATVHTPADHGRWMTERDTFPSDLIRREVLAKKRRALVIYGGMHLQRRNLSFNYEEPSNGGVDTIVSSLERRAPTAVVFNVWTNTAVDLADLQNVGTWPTPSLALIRGTPLGAADFTFYYRFDDRRSAFTNGDSVPIPREQWRTLRMEDQFDALLYLGPPNSISSSKFPQELCSDAGYIKMRTERMKILGLTKSAESLMRSCAIEHQE